METVLEPMGPCATDVSDLVARCLGRRDLAARLLLRFREALETDFAELERALQGADAELAARLAHRLKGSAFAVSAHAIAACTQDLEVRLAQNPCESRSLCLSQLKGCCEQFYQDLPRLLVALSHP